MNIKEYCSVPQGAVKKIDDKVNNIITTFTQKMSNPVYRPWELIGEYSPILDDIQQQWSRCVNHSVVTGIRVKKILIKSLCGFTIDDYILRRFNFKVHHRNFSRLSWDINKFYDLSYLVTGLLFAKYEEVYELEIKFSILKVGLDFFEIYKEVEWTASPQDIIEVIDTVLGSNYDSFSQKYITEIKSKITAKVPQLKKTLIKTKPQCAEDFKNLFYEDMTTQEWYSSIMSYWDISYATMYRYFHRFGMEVRQYGDTPSPEQKKIKELEAIVNEQQERIDHLMTQREELIKMIEKLVNN